MTWYIVLCRITAIDLPLYELDLMVKETYFYCLALVSIVICDGAP
jgi:hypothetical protein